VNVAKKKRKKDTSYLTSDSLTGLTLQTFKYNGFDSQVILFVCLLISSEN